MQITDIFIRRPVLASVIGLLILLGGIASFQSLAIRQFPALQSTAITVSTRYPGASPELMKSFITTPIAQAVATSDGIDYLTSTSFTGQSVVTAHLKLNYDSEKALTNVLAKVQQVKYFLPRDANDPIIVKDTGQETPALFIGFASDELSRAAISDYITRAVQPFIGKINGVASTEILGGQTFAMRLWLDPAKMAARRISADEVAAAIRSNHFLAAPGQVKGHYTVTNIIAETELNDVEQFRDLVVRSVDDDMVRIRDVAAVELGAQNTDSSVTMNGRKAVFLAVKATPDGNPMDTVDAIRAALPEFKRGLPPTLGAEITYDSTKFIRASIQEVVRTIAMSVVVVVLVIFLFLASFRAVLIPLVTIPLSIVGVMVVMLALGFSLNLLTLLAIVLAIGLVVDDAIVVAENVHRWIEHGETPVRAALLGAREIAGPVVAMTLTLAAVFAPIGLLGGLTGALFREFAVTLAGSVIISGVIALVVSPMMCSKLLTKNDGSNRLGSAIDAIFTACSDWYGHRLSSSLDFRPAVVILAIGVSAIVAFEFKSARRELAPAEDQGILFAAVKAPQYANVDYLEAFGPKIDKVFRSFQETDADFIISGTESANQGLAGMMLKPWERRNKTAQDLYGPLSGMLAAEAEGVRAFVFSPPPLPGSTGGLPVRMVVSTPGDYETLYKVMEELKQKAQASGLFLFVDSDLEFNQPTLKMRVDSKKANNIGVSLQAVGNTLALMMSENYLNFFSLSGRSYQVIPQAARERRLVGENLQNFFVKTGNGDMAPLATVTAIERSVRPNALSQFNQLNSATFSALPVNGIKVGQAVSLLREIAHEILPKDYQFDFLSESRQFVQEGNKLDKIFILALVAIYLILAAQFESFRDPLIILVSVPMALCGALFPIFLGTISLNVYTQIGLVTLVGLIAKHGILMVNFANEKQARDGFDKRAAIVYAAQIRLRPILMTSVAMVVGMLPLLGATGAGAASRFAIGVVIITGLSVGTLFTLFVLPTVYTLLSADHNHSAHAVDGALEAACSPAKA